MPRPFEPGRGAPICRAMPPPHKLQRIILVLLVVSALVQIGVLVFR